MSSLHSIIVSVLFLFVIISQTSSNPAERLKRQSFPCGRYEEPIQNDIGETKCIPKQGSCDGSPDYVYISCFISPCPTSQTMCPSASYCFLDACNKCKARNYDQHYNEVCPSRGPFTYKLRL